MTEVIHAIDVMTIFYIVIAIPILLFVSSLAYHYAEELNHYNTSKRIDKTFKDGYKIIQKYNDALTENEKLREKLINPRETGTLTSTLDEICKKYNIPLEDVPEVLEEYIATDNEEYLEKLRRQKQ